MPSAPASSEMLAEMGACAYRLGLAFGTEAERTEDWDRQLQLFQLFDRCFFAVRVSIVLELRLKREAGAVREPAADTEDLRDHEPPEFERPERPERERLDADREREREAEQATVPTFLNTLKSVAADAAALPGPAPAELPTLQELLAKATGAPASPKPNASPLRDRLTGSAAVAVMTPPRPPPGLPPRRSTGPPLPPPRSGGRGTAR